MSDVIYGAPKVSAYISKSSVSAKAKVRLCHVITPASQQVLKTSLLYLIKKKKICFNYNRINTILRQRKAPVREMIKISWQQTMSS